MHHSADMRNTIQDQNLPSINGYMYLESCSDVDFDGQVWGNPEILHLEPAPS